MTQPVTPQEIGELIAEHAGALELYASQWTGAADDCVQEALIELAAQASRPVAPVAWLYRVVRHRAINSSRSARRRQNHERLAAMLSSAYLFDPSLQDERIRLRRSLDNLSTADRELVVLRIWSGLEWQAIAELTGCSTSTAHRRYVAALRKLKQLLESPCPTNLKSRET